ncbi:pyridoxal phosphate-dependent transferase [Haematococcus lacustris]
MNLDCARVSFDHYWSEEARALKASALADLVNAFAGVPDVVTLHAGLPSTDSFPLLTICASSLPHCRQACQVPTAAASVLESAQPTGAATTDCASSHTASRQVPLALHLGPGLAGSSSSLYSSAFCQQSDSGAASACLSEDDVTPGLAPESEISEGLLGLPKLAPVATAQPTDPALPDVQAKLSQQAAGQQAAGLVADRQLESEKPPAGVVNASPACETKEHGGSAGADAGAGHVSGPSSVEADAQEGGQSTPAAVPPSLGSSQASGPQGPLPLLSAAGLPPVTISIGGQLVFDAQQYMFHSGHAPLRQWATHIVQHCHAPPLPFHTAITSGAVHALNAAIACLCDKGDFVVCEEFAYTHAPECIFIPRGLIMLPVALDEQGMVPDSLRRVLASHPASPVTGKAPRILYIIPSGQNPTGSVMPLERKQQIYEICREHNMLILEDDAYYWLQYPGGALPAAQQLGLQLPPSFLSLDTDGRVLRIDTFSKLLGPGYRLGWVSGAPALVAKIAQAIQGSSCGSCPLAQVIVAQLLQAWGRAGFTTFVQQQQALYARRAAVAAAAARHHLAGLATWASPSAGMFMWFRLTGLPDVDTRLLAQLVQQRVVVVPGRPFWTDIALAKGGAPCPFFRVTFGAVPEQDIEVGFARLAAAIRGVLTQAAGEDLESVSEPQAAGEPLSSS